MVRSAFMSRCELSTGQVAFWLVSSTITTL